MGKGLGSVHSHQINHDRCKHQDVLFKYFYNKFTVRTSTGWWKISFNIHGTILATILMSSVVQELHQKIKYIDLARPKSGAPQNFNWMLLIVKIIIHYNKVSI